MERGLTVLLGFGMLLTAVYLGVSYFIGSKIKEQIDQKKLPLVEIENYQQGLLQSSFDLSAMGGTGSVNIKHHLKFAGFSKNWPFVKVSAVRGFLKNVRLPPGLQSSFLDIKNLRAKLDVHVDKSVKSSIRSDGLKLNYPSKGGWMKSRVVGPVVVFGSVNWMDREVVFATKGGKSKITMPLGSAFHVGSFLVKNHFRLEEDSYLKGKMLVSVNGGQSMLCGVLEKCKKHSFKSFQATANGKTLISKSISQYDARGRSIENTISYLSTQLGLLKRQRSPGSLAINWKLGGPLNANFSSNFVSSGKGSKMNGKMSLVAFPLSNVKQEIDSFLPNYFNNLVLDRWITVKKNSIKTIVELKNNQFFINGRRANFPQAAH